MLMDNGVLHKPTNSSWAMYFTFIPTFFIIYKRAEASLDFFPKAQAERQ
jgi:hypothetical protein